MGQTPHNTIKIQCGRHPLSQGKTICSDPQLLQEEEQHLFQALKRCKYPKWALNRIKIKSQAPTKNKSRSNTNNAGQNNNSNQNPYMIVPYYKGLSESIKISCRKFGVQVHCKGGLNHQKPPHGSKG